MVERAHNLAAAGGSFPGAHGRLFALHFLLGGFILLLGEHGQGHKLLQKELFQRADNALENPVNADCGRHDERDIHAHQRHADVHHVVGATGLLIHCDRLIGKLAVDLHTEEVDHESQHRDHQQHIRLMEAGHQTHILPEQTEVREGDVGQLVITVARVGEIQEVLQPLRRFATEVGKQLDSAAGVAQRHAKPARRTRGGAIGGQCGGETGGKPQHVAQRVYHDVVQRNDDRELDKQRQAPAHGVKTFLLIHLLQLRLHFLHGRLVVAPGVLFADCHFLRAHFRLFDGVFLLFDAKRQHDDFDDNRKDEERQHVVAAGQLGENLQKLADPDKQRVNRTVFGGDLHRRLHFLHHSGDHFGGQLFAICGIFGFGAVIGGGHGRQRRLGAFQVYQPGFRVFALAAHHFGDALGSSGDYNFGYFGVVKALGAHVIAARRRREFLPRGGILL